MKATELVVPAAVVVGGAYVIGRLIPDIPNPITAVVDAFNSAIQWISGQKLWGYMTFAKDTMHRTETNSIAATGLKPNTAVIYGWKELGFSMQLDVGPTGEFYFEFGIADSTPNGTYTVYLDQRPNQGPYGERKLTVIA